MQRETNGILANKVLLKSFESLYFTAECLRLKKSDMFFRREALGRAVVIPMTLQLPYMSEEDFEDFQRGKEFASRYFENLVCVSDAEVDRLWSRAFSLRRAVSQRLEDITDSQHRIAENYSMLIAATELVCVGLSCVNIVIMCFNII